MSEQILGFNLISVVVFVALAGVGYRILYGTIGKSREEISFRKILTTGIIGLISGIVLVIPVFQSMGEGVSELTQLLIIVSAIASVIGADAGINSFQKSYKRKQNGLSELNEELEEEFPPGND